ncbi:MAG: hypothetical protein ACR2FH_05690 [Caulobacteraceae bacterium]
MIYRIVLVCDGVSKSVGPEAARDIAEEFRTHYPHEKNVLCTYARGKLMLVAENDYDPDGSALMDEFSDNIAAYIAEPFNGEINVLSVEVF